MGRIRAVQTWVSPGQELRSLPCTWPGEMSTSEKEARNRRQCGKHGKRRSCVDSKGVSEQGETNSGSEGPERLLSGEDFHLWGWWASHFLYVPCVLYVPLLLYLSLGAALCSACPCSTASAKRSETIFCLLLCTCFLAQLGTSWMHSKLRCR